MATGRIGVTPTLGVRWSKAPTGGTTSLSGLDDNSVSLVYSVGYEQVYRNGVLLSRGNDYTATNGTTVTLTDATITGDIIEIFAQQLVPLTDAISKGQFTAKGALLSATAASTPGVLGVGANGTVLTAASGEATGLQWATPASAVANFSLLNAGGTALSGVSTRTVSGISGQSTLMVLVVAASINTATPGEIRIRLNTDTGANYTQQGSTITFDTSYNAGAAENLNYEGVTAFYVGRTPNNASGSLSAGLTIMGCNSAGLKVCQSVGMGSANSTYSQRQDIAQGFYNSASTISSVSVNADYTFDGGRVYVYGSAV